MRPNLYAPLRPGLRLPLQGLTVQAQGLFEVYAICYAPGDWVNIISSKEAKNRGLAWSYTSNRCEGPPDHASPKSCPEKDEGVMGHKSLG